MRPDARPGRGAPENRTPTRFNLAAREADGDWLDAREELDGEPPPLRTTVTVEKPKTIITRNAIARHRLRPLDQPLSRLRAWLHLLLRAADPRLPRSLPRPRFRKPAVRQARRGETAPRRADEEGLSGPPDRARHQHRSLPADRGQMADHPLHPRSARRDEASGDDHHQIGPGARRSRPASPRWRRTA